MVPSGVSHDTQVTAAFAELKQEKKALQALTSMVPPARPTAFAWRELNALPRTGHT
jgi:hypothetical protein